MQNRLFYGDNLDILRDYEYFPSESVDLIYLDPPFNSSRSYNVLFQDESGLDSEAQIMAFDDTWHWGYVAEATYRDLWSDAPESVATAIKALRDLIGENQMMAYLVMMAARLVELYRVLKPTGNLYLHCDPTASHYLKIVLDAIFGSPECFRNEIVWRRTGSHNKVGRYGPIHDVIFFYAKNPSRYIWNNPKVPYMKGHVEENFVKDEYGYRTNYYGNVLTGSGTRGGESGRPWRGFDPTAKGRHWAVPRRLVEESGEDMSDLSQHEKLDRLYELGYIKIVEGEAWPIYEHRISEDDGVPMSDIWAFQPYTQGTVFGREEGIDEDVRWLHPRAAERMGYPTQKPLALLERIVKASSDPGGVVLDPFCGCGTAIAAAQKLGRRWIGIDITHLSVALQKNRLAGMFGLAAGQDYEVIGEPVTVDGARQLAQDDPFQFQFWATGLVHAQPLGGQQGSRRGQRGADRGIDGVIRFIEQTDGSSHRAIVQVKSGHVQSGDIRDLVGTVTREDAAIGVFITLQSPTRDMIREAASAGFYRSPGWGKDFPKIQILTIQELLDGRTIEMPPAYGTFPQAKRVKPEPENRNLELFSADDLDA